MAPRTRGTEATSDAAQSNAIEEHENPLADLARKYWIKSKKAAKVKVKPDVVKEIWDTLAQQDFQYRSLLALENLQALERYIQISSFSST